MVFPTRYIVIDNRRCTPLEPQDKGVFKGRSYGLIPPDSGSKTWMVANEEDSWDVPIPKMSLPGDVYITLNKDSSDADVVVRQGTDAGRETYYKLMCEGSQSLSRRINGEMVRVYDDMDKMDIALSSNEICFNAYSARFHLAGTMMLAAKYGKLDYLQQVLGLSDVDFTEEKIIAGFKLFLFPQPCEADLKEIEKAKAKAAASAAAVPTPTPEPAQAQASSTPTPTTSLPVPVASRAVPQPTATAEPLVERVHRALVNIEVRKAVDDPKARNEAREAGISVSPTRATIKGTPRMLPIQFVYTSWVAFGLSDVNPNGDLNAVARRLIATITKAADAETVTAANFRVVFITQRASDNVVAATKTAAGDIEKAGILVSVLDQRKQVHRVDDIIQKGRERLTTEDEKFVNSVIVAVLPASVPADDDAVMAYYAEFLNRQGDGWAMMDKLKTQDFSK